MQVTVCSSRLLLWLLVYWFYTSACGCKETVCVCFLMDVNKNDGLSVDVVIMW